MGCFFYEQLLTTLVNKVLIFNPLNTRNFSLYLFYGLRKTLKR